MIKAFKRILGCFTLFVFVFSCYLSVYAAGQIYDNVKITELVKVPTKTVEDEKCSNLGCIGINEANGKNCMFAVKAGQNDGVAVLYYYPDMSDLTTRKHFIIYGAGHANGMTIDSNYIYITTWSNKNIDENEGISNEIMQIPKNLFNTLSSGSVVPEKSNSTGGIELLQPMKINTDPQTKEDNPYVKYTESFSSITKHKKDNTFIIKKNINGVSGTAYEKDFSFTTAKIIKINGNRTFVVSENTDDMFIVKNNLDYKNVTSQDICYNEGNGLFLPKWYGSYNKTKSVILWADIDTTPSYVNIKGVSYKYFEPDIISVDMSERMTYGVLKYSTYEYESVAFTPERDLIVACNIVYTSDYVNAYEENNDGKSPGSDRIIRIRKSGGGKFTVN